MLNRDFEALTVNGACDLTVKNILAGSPLTLGANGYKLAKAGDEFFGLSYNYYYDGKNDVTGGEWFTDSAKVGVVKVAQVTLGCDEINGVKVAPFVMPSEMTSGQNVYAPKDKLYINADGKLTNVQPAAVSGQTAEPVATVVAFNADTVELTIFVNVK